MDDLMLSLTDVTIRYPDQRLFTNISFELKKGQHWAFTGTDEPAANALLLAIAGKLPVTSGKSRFPFYDAFVHTHAINDPLLSPHKLIYMVASRHAFKTLSNTGDFYYQQRYNSSDSENSLTVGQYLSAILPLANSRIWTLEKTLTELNVAHQANKQLIKLSNGETKRILIAAALLRNPVILLLDNLLTGLDVQSRQDIKKLISHIAASGTTVIMTTSPHEIPEAITHIGMFEKNGIRYMAASSFDAGAVAAPDHKEPDESEIRALLAINPPDEYEDIVRMKNVCVRYEDKLILDSIDWNIKQGERWALLGHNGAGKSTLLSLVNGDNPQAYANDIILFDRKRGSGESIWEIKKKTGFVSAELYQYFPNDSSCIQTVESGFYDTLGLFRQSRPEMAQLSLRWMKLLGIGHLAGKLLRSVPANEQRLCLLARALVKNPALLILDEPCQGFNDQQLQDFKDLLDKICSVSNLTLIYVTHYQHEIPASVNKLIRLKDGMRVE